MLTTTLRPLQLPPINALLLQPGIAVERLVKQDIFMPIIDSVALPDPAEDRVVVTYHSLGTDISQTIDLTLADFMRPFMRLRLQKAQDYDCVPAGTDAFDVVHRRRPDSRYRVERHAVDGRTYLDCPCQHAVSQAVFTEFPIVWQRLGEQPHCKHIVRAAQAWGIDLPGLAMLV